MNNSCSYSNKDANSICIIKSTSYMHINPEKNSIIWNQWLLDAGKRSLVPAPAAHATIAENTATLLL
jgi:hypothetical protein